MKDTSLCDLSKENKKTYMESEWENVNTSYQADDYRWVLDHEVTNCTNCKSLFNVWNRRHHCRYCGNIFCNNCANDFRDLKGFLKVQRVCRNCSLIIDKQSEKYRLWCIFRFMDIKDIGNLATVSKSYYELVKSFKTNLQTIQHYYIYRPLSCYDIEQLSTNYNILAGHSKWIVPLIKSNPSINTFLITKQESCQNIGCGIGCQNKLLVEDYMQILSLSLRMHLDNSIIQHCCDNIDQQISKDEIIAMVPLLIKLCNSEIVQRLVISLSTRDSNILFLIYWESLQTATKIIISIIESEHLKKSTDNTALISGIKDTFIELSLLECTGYKNIGNIFAKTKLYFCNKNDIWIATNIIKEQIETKKSKSRPVLLPFTNSNKEIKSFLYKAEDLRTDYIISQTIKLMLYYIKQEIHIDVNYIHYDIYLLKNNYGLIEMIDDSYTIYDIRNKLKTSILLYILDNNPKETNESVRNKFIYSLAVYSVITYLLGIGDRHLDNIMIHKSGNLFHIDFEYILGDDPKMRSQTMRITDDMVETLGGKNNPNYLRFKELCSVIFNCLRKHVNIFIVMLSLLSSEQISEAKIFEEIIRRFEPGDKYLSASTYITTIIDSSHDTVTSSVMDFLYRCTKIFK